MCGDRDVVSDRAVRSDLVVVSTPILQLFVGIGKVHEPVGIQAFGSEFAVERFDEPVVRRLAWTREDVIREVRPDIVCVSLSGSDEQRPRLPRTMLLDKLTAITASQAAIVHLLSSERRNQRCNRAAIEQQQCQALQADIGRAVALAAEQAKDQYGCHNDAYQHEEDVIGGQGIVDRAFTVGDIGERRDQDVEAIAAENTANGQGQRAPAHRRNRGYQFRS